jgi:hypothetical protein
VATRPYCGGVAPLEMVVPAPADSVDFYAYGVGNTTGVWFPSWSAVNGQDDLVWHPGVDQGGGVWKGTVNLVNHRPGTPDYGPFAVHVWMSGPPFTFCGAVTLTRTAPPPPSCTGLGPEGIVTAATSGTLDIFAYGVQNATGISFATWSGVNGQDDLVWYPGVNLGGGTWRASIDLSRHRSGSPDYGTFSVHPWMTGTQNVLCGGLTFTRAVSVPPSCTGAGPHGVITHATSGALDLYAYGVQNATSVSFAAWSDINWQDDLIWYPGVQLGGGTWKASIDLARHRPSNADYGLFHVHLWMGGTPNSFCGGITFQRQ